VKKIFTVIFLMVLFSCSSAPDYRSFDEALENAINRVENDLPEGSDVAILDFKSDNPNLSSYIIEEIYDKLINNRKLTIMERSRTDTIAMEIDYQLSGEVDDREIINFGHQLGADYVVTGQITLSGKAYRLRVFAIDIEKGRRIASSSLNINPNDRQIKYLLSSMPKVQPSPRQRPEIFDNYTFFNGLTIFGYTYSPDKPLGFSLGAYGVYTSFGFAVPDLSGYQKSSSPSGFDELSDTEQRYEIVDWVIGYNVTLIPNILYMPIGVGTEAVRELRLYSYLIGGIGDYGGSGTVWRYAPQWETSLLFEAGLLFRVKTPVNFAPYLFGTYRNIGFNKHGFSTGVGGCFDFLANK
jgi:TolB-like protein